LGSQSGGNGALESARPNAENHGVAGGGVAEEDESWVGLTVKVGTEDGYSRSMCGVGSRRKRKA